MKFDCFFIFLFSFLTRNLLKYNLTLAAHDTYYEGRTTVRIRVKDINDLAPMFERNSYSTTIFEEEKYGLPKRILQVCYLFSFFIIISTRFLAASNNLY